MNNALENYLVQRADQRGEPIKATLELTPLCNLDCRMCYLRHTAAEVREKGGLLPLSFWQGLIPPMKEAGVLFVAMIGGEIFLLPWLEELYCRLHGSGFHLNFTTNATLLADGVPPWLAERKPRYATVSLYGASDETYQRLTGNPRGFTRAAAGLKNLLRAGIATKLNVLVTPENVGDMGEIVRIARENGLPVTATAYSFPNGVRNSCGGSPRLAPEEAARTEIELRRLTRTEEEFRDWLAYLRWEAEPDAEHYRHMTCRAASSTLWINWRGRMAACGMMEEPAVDLRQRIPFAEAWQLLRIRILREMDRTGKKVLLLTSTGELEGKSTISSNLALSCAQKGFRVLLIDGDLRSPSVAKKFGLETEAGILDVLTGGAALEQAVHHYPDTTLDILPGHGTANAAGISQLIGGEETARVMEYAREHYDYVIVDSPPCGIIQDALMLAAHCDASLVVIRQDFLARTRILEMLDVLADTGTEILGCVINGEEGSVGSYGYGRYGYGSGYGYGKYGNYGKYGSGEKSGRKTEKSAPQGDA